MASYTFNQRERQPVPAGLYWVKVEHIPGFSGENGDLTRSKSGDLDMAKFKLTVEHERRHLNGTVIYWMPCLAINPDAEPNISEAQMSKYETTIRIAMEKMSRMVNSGHGLSADDGSPAAEKLRSVTSLAQLSGLRVYAKVGLRPPENGFAASNQIVDFVTPDDDEWPGKPKLSLEEDTGDPIPY